MAAQNPRAIFSAHMMTGLADLIESQGMDRWYTMPAEQAVRELIALCGPALDKTLADLNNRTPDGDTLTLHCDADGEMGPMRVWHGPGEGWFTSAVYVTDEQVEAACRAFWEEWPLPMGDDWTAAARRNMHNALTAAATS